jgi:hypothetical protein
VHHRRREALFLARSGALIALLTLVTLLDGGVGSPLAVLYFLPPVYAALSYPSSSMAAVAVADIAAYVAAGAAGGGASGRHIGVVALTLGTAGWMCGWQTRAPASWHGRAPFAVTRGLHDPPNDRSERPRRFA